MIVFLCNCKDMLDKKKREITEVKKYLIKEYLIKVKFRLSLYIPHILTILSSSYNIIKRT